jgi:hypothetical protein
MLRNHQEVFFNMDPDNLKDELHEKGKSELEQGAERVKEAMRRRFAGESNTAPNAEKKVPIQSGNSTPALENEKDIDVDIHDQETAEFEAIDKDGEKAA